MPSPRPPIAAFFDESLSHTGGAAPRFVPAEEEGAPEWEVIGTPGGRLREAPRPGDKVLRRALGEGRLITELVVEQVEAGAARSGHPVQASGRHLRLTDRRGRLPLDLMVLRPSAGRAEADEQHDEADAHHSEADLPAEAVAVDAAIALPALSPARRAAIGPLLSPAAHTAAQAWNAARHPARSGVDAADLATALAPFVDASAAAAAITAWNTANPTTPIPPGTAPWTAALVECVHQAQRKLYVESRQHDGKAGNSLLDSLGLMPRTGMTHSLAATHRHTFVRSRDRQIRTATGARITGATWYNWMMNPTFLGRTFNNPVHYTFIVKLRQAEQALHRNPRYAGMSPVELGAALSITEGHKGGRTGTDGGMHSIGLAVDLNYVGNPYILGEARCASCNDPAVTAAVQRGALLMSARTASLSMARLGALGASTTMSTAAIYDELAADDRDLRAYLVATTAAISARLAAGPAASAAGLFRSSTESVASATTRWEAQRNADLAALRAAANFVGRDPRNGFLNLHRDLVIALRDDACLAWGAVDFGSGASGDVMHFDDRRAGLGADLNERGFRPTLPCVNPAAAAISAAASAAWSAISGAAAGAAAAVSAAGAILGAGAAPREGEDDLGEDSEAADEAAGTRILHRASTTLPVSGRRLTLRKELTAAGLPRTIAKDEHGRTVDLAAAKRAEWAAFFGRYRTIQPMLFRMMEAGAPARRYLLSIWGVVTPDDTLPDREDSASAPLLVASREAVDTRGMGRRPGEPASVEGPSEAEQRRRAEVRRRNEALATELRATGVEVEGHFEAVPLLLAEASAEQIRRMAQSPRVGAIYLRELDGVDNLGTSLAISRGAGAVADGFTGSGVKVAVWERGPDNTTNLSITAQFATGIAATTSQHARLTTGIIRNSQAGGPNGYAPAATMYAANSYGPQALYWAAITQTCSVVSQSFHHPAEETSGDLSSDDLLKDYLATHYPFPTIVMAAGNGGSTEYVNHKSFNTLTVGSHNDNASAIVASSVFRNPNSEHGDRELPELSANGDGVTAVGLTMSGTSFAAPAVAGAAAQVMQVDGALKLWPEGVRAILLAACRLNPRGRTWWNDLRNRTDGRDGVGALNAREATRIAGSRQRAGSAATSRGWDVGTFSSASVDAQGLSTASWKITAPSGRSRRTRLKAALAFSAKVTTSAPPSAATPSTVTSARLEVDLDLHLFEGSRLVAWSSSFDNSYEVIDHTLVPGRSYELRVRRWSGTDWTWFGLAWDVHAPVSGAAGADDPEADEADEADEGAPFAESDRADETFGIDRLRIHLCNADGSPAAGVRYQARFRNGAVSTGVLDAAGRALIDDKGPGDVQVTFPDLDPAAWSLQPFGGP
jgi:hypothetical protein